MLGVASANAVMSDMTPKQIILRKTRAMANQSLSRPPRVPYPLEVKP